MGIIVCVCGRGEKERLWTRCEKRCDCARVRVRVCIYDVCGVWSGVWSVCVGVRILYIVKGL